MDVKKTFLHGDLKETIYMHVPAGIDTPASSVCRLHWLLYWLKQAPRAWFAKFRTIIINSSFKQSHLEYFVFLLYIMNGITIVLVYMDDILIIAYDSSWIKMLQCTLRSCFHMKDFGPITYCFGSWSTSFKTMDHANAKSQTKYTKEIVDLAQLKDSKPMEVNVKFHIDFDHSNLWSNFIP